MARHDPRRSYREAWECTENLGRVVAFPSGHDEGLGTEAWGEWSMRAKSLAPEE
jgi:hypothetical protein